MGGLAGPLVAAILSALTLLAATWSAAFAADADRLPFGGVVDYAKLFDAAERQSLELATGRIARHAGLDVFVATIDDQSLTWSWRRETNREIIDRVFRDVKAAARKHFGYERPLVLLSVFKHQPVLYLNTDKDELASALLFDNFYSGAKGAFDRVRDPGQDTYHDATMRYLEAFAKRLVKAEEPTRYGLIRMTLLSKFAELDTRDVIASPVFEPFYIAFEAARSKLEQQTSWTGAVSFLAVFAACHLLLIATLQLLPALAFEPGGAALPRLMLTGLHQSLQLPLMLIVYSVTSADLENLVHLAQVSEHLRGTAGTDVLTYLTWAEYVAGLVPPAGDMADNVAVAAMAVVGGVTAARIWHFRSEGWIATLREAFEAVLRTPTFVLSLVIFPEALQLYLVAIALTTQALLWAIASQTAKSSASPDEPRAGPKLEPTSAAGRIIL